MQRHMHHAGEQAGEVDEDPVGGMGADVRDAIAGGQPRGGEGIGERRRGRDQFAPGPCGGAGVARPRFRRRDGLRQRVDDRTAIGGIVEPAVHQFHERLGRGSVAGTP